MTFATFAAALLTSVLALACRPTPTVSTSPSPSASRVAALDMTASLSITSEEVSFTSGDHVVPGTLARPQRPGMHRAVVLMAGSGPTDRDWNNQLLPGTNGSGKLLAEALARRGVVVLRFDKSGVGGNKAKLDGVTFDIYREEIRAALAYLRTRADVAVEALYIAGHSEGGMHAVRAALEEKAQLAGLLLLATSARTMQSLLLAQIETQLRTAAPDRADAEIASLRVALDAFVAGEPVDATKASTIRRLQMLVTSLANPATASLLRGMFAWDPLAAVAQITVPILVVSGRRDIQVDPELDATRLAAANPAAELHIAPDADHVLKRESRLIAELRVDPLLVQTQMNAEGRVLDTGAVEIIATWLSAH